MNLFGDPRAPRQNLWGGLVLTAFGAFLAGLAAGGLERPELWPGAHRNDWASKKSSIACHARSPATPQPAQRNRANFPL